jgi:hypothetical protein
MKPDQKGARAALDILILSGREMGRKMLADAFLKADSPSQMTAQVFTLQVSAGHILALCAFNQESQSKDGDQWLDELLVQIKHDLELIRVAHEQGDESYLPFREKHVKDLKV